MAETLAGIAALGVGRATAGAVGGAVAEALGGAGQVVAGLLARSRDTLVKKMITLIRITYNLVDKEKVEIYTKEKDELGVELELEEELKAVSKVSKELMAVTNIMKVAELKVNEYKETRKKEKIKLENSVSVRFGSGENSLESSGTKVDTSGDSSELEEEVVSLASTVERIRKNLNLKITQLKRSFEESWSNTERLQSLIEKQAQDIAEKMLYIKDLEDKEKKLAQNVEGFMMKIKEAEVEVARWREACELEIEPGKHEIEQRDIVATAEKSLQLADSTAAGLCERVEEMSKQLEEAESQYRNRYNLRHICWPWRTLKLSTAAMNNRLKNAKKILSKCRPW
ncbi:hypothetical protein FEM48_Zijuj03G0159300 [Ziziphus jujuba var. spinosa]|uniref:Uncharacterized protein n=1 Tax=Ziziphus jujuba var. spinosa TaxID=714518 RepID=A0A978VR87_ZIZJJ|nr:hypothetical protein FEM48_Zijuj03G0159300 [Ziziphus jujuba var. spinosa]